MVRAALLSSASLVASVAATAFLLPSAASAQTVCTGTPGATETDIECTDGAAVVVTGTTDLTTTVNAAPQGLSLTSGAAQTTTLQPGPDGDTVTTTGSTGIFASSGGLLTLTAPDVNVATTSLAIPIDSVLFTAPILNATLGDITNNSLNSSALEISVPGAVTVITGDLATTHPFSGHVVNVPGGAGPLSLTTGDISGVGSNAAGVFLLRFG
ncbi:MAG TPA: hypothetical protein VFP57_07590, partial [Sphingomicrobium sp.]|nr:hypothetical protein [Sphingomicrobium sp.]